MTQSDQIAIFREVMGNYPTGVAIITSTDQAGHPVGLTVNSFASVSLDPLLILWSIDHRSSSLDAFLSTDKFAVHILAEDQKELAGLFAKKGASRFSNCDWKLSADQVPIVNGAAAVLHCDVYNFIAAGDHTIIIGKVRKMEQTNSEPLLFHKGKMSSLLGDTSLMLPE